MKARKLIYLLTAILAGSFTAAAQTPTNNIITVPMGGNAWRVAKDTAGGTITNDGIVDWTDAKVQFKAYFRVVNKGSFGLWLNLKVPGGKSVLAVSALGQTKHVAVFGSGVKQYYVGDWTVADTGYIAVNIKAISKTGKTYAEISNMKLSGSVINNKTSYVPTNEGNFFHWGRRGPSVHLAYALPKSNIEWFYNEVTVPVGNDVLGSYFMADGFNVGYFGMQVNSPTERHILFSVWSPFTTDDPKAIPDSQKIVMLKKGANVHTGEFGSEGSGGQSYMNYNWKAGNTYKFLIRAQPGAHNHTTYTAWFFAPEVGQWQLIASFSRPQTHTYLMGLHSFLENFEPEQGTITRQVHFSNEWIADDKGQWTEITSAHFTNDATAMKRYRMDYAGGVSGTDFFLKNCGFFNDFTQRGVLLQRAAVGKQPDVDLDKLP